MISRLGVERDAEAAVVEVGDRLAELRPAAVRRVLVRARDRPRPAASASTTSRRRRRVGSPMPRLITSTPAAFLSAILRSSSANRYGGRRSSRAARLHASLRASRKLAAELARVHGHRPAGQVHVQVLAHLDLELAAVEVDGDRAVERRAEPRRPRRRSRRCPTTSSRRRRARRSARVIPPSDSRAPERDVGAVREQLVALDRRADRRQVELLQPLGDLDRALRVADRDVLEGAARARRPRACRGRRPVRTGSPSRSASRGPCPPCRSSAR